MLAAVLAFNTGDYLLKVLDALNKHNLRIIVIDNGSEPPVDTGGINCVRLDKGCGIIHGRNLGFAKRDVGEGVIVVADDVIAPEGPWEKIFEDVQDRTLAMRPAGDIAFTQYQRFDDPDKYKDYIPGAPTSFQFVHFPGPVLDKIGYVDERYLWGDDGLMMRKHQHGVLRNYNIIPNQRLPRGPKYRPLREFYEELWRPGKLDGEHWESLPIRHTLEETNARISDKCPTIWTMNRTEDPLYYDVSLLIKSSFEAIWDDIAIDRPSLLKRIINEEAKGRLS